ncbi:MAG: pyridoxal-dependent decarboxylase [Roseburia sp.]|nr:pyridoxal-dependent decarboxylase [Roseburia sp.]
MLLDSGKMKYLCKEYGDAFYILDSEQFRMNYNELINAFRSIYPKFNIAYSYKTNYTPELCKIVNQMGGYAEVVSDMEVEIAQRIGVSPSKIIWNGPYKNAEKMKELLLVGGTVNIDSAYEFDIVRNIASAYPEKVLNIGIRCNFEINDGVLSRFGLDVNSKEFQEALELVEKIPNLQLFGLQCHFASRKLDTWKNRTEGMLKILDKYNIVPKHLDLGGGLFGKMPDSLKKQFDSEIPTYQDYANESASVIKQHYAHLDDSKKPMLLLEPGSALVGDCMSFVSRVINIKQVRGKSIATLLGSIYNINPTLNKKNPPITVFHMGGEEKQYEDLDFGGFTCIESDYIYKHFTGELALGDMVLFGNAGSYSVVLKPPFILPNFPVIDICEDNIKVIKRKEYFDDIFHTFAF